MLFKPEGMVEEASLALIEELLNDKTNPFDRNDFEPGHLTSSAFIVNKECTHCVLMHHKKLDKWLQPGGHAEGEISVKENAMKEAQEETGMKTLVNTGKIHTVDVHVIPEYKGQPEHHHHDICYLFQADINEKPVGNHESNFVKWVSLEEAKIFANAEYALSHMIEKLQ